MQTQNVPNYQGPKRINLVPPELNLSSYGRYGGGSGYSILSSAFKAAQNTQIDDMLNYWKQHSDYTMTQPTREEIDAKLQAAEARTEARFVSLDGKLDLVLNQISGFNDQVRDLKAEIKNDVKELRSEVRSENKTTRWTVFAIAVAALVGGLGALWTSQSNLLSAFQLVLAEKHVVVAPKEESSLPQSTPTPTAPPTPTPAPQKAQ